MNQKQIFADPEEKKPPGCLNSGPLQQSSEEQEEDIDVMLREIAALLVQSQELLDKLP